MGRRADLAEFLRVRRGALHPTDVGLAPGGRRRTVGLRREEVALLAGVSLSWYTWLEQGRPIKPSADVLQALARTFEYQQLVVAGAPDLRVVVQLPVDGDDSAERLATVR